MNYKRGKKKRTLKRLNKERRRREGSNKHKLMLQEVATYSEYNT
jgi:hypothetical protein